MGVTMVHLLLLQQPSSQSHLHHMRACHAVDRPAEPSLQQRITAVTVDNDNVNNDNDGSIRLHGLQERLPPRLCLRGCVTLFITCSGQAPGTSDASDGAQGAVCCGGATEHGSAMHGMGSPTWTLHRGPVQGGSRGPPLHMHVHMRMLRTVRTRSGDGGPCTLSAVATAPVNWIWCAASARSHACGSLSNSRSACRRTRQGLVCPGTCMAANTGGVATRHTGASGSAPPQSPRPLVLQARHRRYRRSPGRACKRATGYTPERTATAEQQQSRPGQQRATWYARRQCRCELHWMHLD